MHVWRARLARWFDVPARHCPFSPNTITLSALTLNLVAAVMLNGYAGTQIEATFGERNYETVGRGEFVLALIVFPLVSYTLATNGWTGVRYLGLSIAEWLTALLITFALLGIAQRLQLAGRLERGS